MTAVEIVLMVRGMSSLFVPGIVSHDANQVYALYDRNPFIKYGFLLVLIGEALAMVIGVVLTLPGDEFRVSTILMTTPHSFAYFGYVK